MAPFRRFISIAAHLQLLLGEETPVALPVERLAEFSVLIGESGNDARKCDHQRGILIPRARHVEKGEKGKAARFCVDLSKLERRNRDRSVDKDVPGGMNE